MSDNAYRMFRRVADLTDVIPCLDTLRDLKQELNEILATKLGIKTCTTFCTVQLDLRKCLEFIVDLHNITFPGTPAPKRLIIKFSVDGRPNQGVDEVCIGIVPINLGFAAQSCYSTFPLAVMECKEKQAIPTTRQYAKKLVEFSTLDEMSLAGQKFKIVAVMCSDLVSFWNATGLNYTPSAPAAPGKPSKTPANEEFCPCCKKKSIDIHNLVTLAEERQTLPEIDLPASSYIYCSLHAGMRISGTILESMLPQLSPTEIDRLRVEAREQGIYIKADNEITMYGNTVKELLLEKKSIDDVMDMNESAEAKEAREIEQLTKKLKQSTSTTTLMATVADKFKASPNQLKLLNRWSVVYQLISQPTLLSKKQVELLQTAIDKMKKSWLLQFVNRVTPYAHLVLLHTIQIVQRHGSVGLYSQQGFELSNRLHRSIESRASNHRGGRGDVMVTEQLMNNFYGRLELARDLSLTCFLKMMFGRKVNDELNEDLMNLVRAETKKAHTSSASLTSIKICQNIPSLVPGIIMAPEEDPMELEFVDGRDREDYLNTFVRI